MGRPRGESERPSGRGGGPNRAMPSGDGRPSQRHAALGFTCARHVSWLWWSRQQAPRFRCRASHPGFLGLNSLCWSSGFGQATRCVDAPRLCARCRLGSLHRAHLSGLVPRTTYHAGIRHSPDAMHVPGRFSCSFRSTNYLHCITDISVCIPMLLWPDGIMSES